MPPEMHKKPPRAIPRGGWTAARNLIINRIPAIRYQGRFRLQRVNARLFTPHLLVVCGTTQRDADLIFAL